MPTSTPCTTVPLVSLVRNTIAGNHIARTGAGCWCRGRVGSPGGGGGGSGFGSAHVWRMYRTAGVFV